MLVYSTVRVGVNPQINVVGTLIIVGAALIVIASRLRGQPMLVPPDRAARSGGATR